MQGGRTTRRHGGERTQRALRGGRCCRQPAGGARALLGEGGSRLGKGRNWGLTQAAGAGGSSAALAVGGLGSKHLSGAHRLQAVLRLLASGGVPRSHCTQKRRATLVSVANTCRHARGWGSAREGVLAASPGKLDTASRQRQSPSPPARPRCASDGTAPPRPPRLPHGPPLHTSTPSTHQSCATGDTERLACRTTQGWPTHLQSAGGSSSANMGPRE